MSFSSKEKKILKIVGVILFIVVYFNYYLGFEYKEINEIKTRISDLGNNIKKADYYKEDLISMDNEIKKLKANMGEIRKTYPQELNHDELLMLFKQIEEYSGMKITNITIDESKTLDANTTQTKPGEEKPPIIITDKKLQKLGEDLGIYLNKVSSNQSSDNSQITNPIDNKKKKVEKFPDGKGYSMDVNISAKSDYPGLKKFIGGIEALRNKVVFKKFDINKNADDSITANIALSFYGIKDMVTKLPERVVPVQIGENNLFKPFAGYDIKALAAANKVSNAQEENLHLLADFTSRLLPYGRGLSPQTVTITAKNVVLNNSIGGGVVFGDKEGEEKAQVYIEEKDSKYMFKMKTSSQSYPDANFEKMYEFKPVGDKILFLIDSTIRKSLSDNSSVNFEVTNKSNKIMEIKIINDDKERPRVTITKKAGIIEVKN